MKPTPHSVHYPLDIYFDGSCKLCAGEIANLAARDPAGKLRMIDCSAPGFDTSNMPATQAELMNLIHARDAHGQWLKGVDVFAAAYAAADLAWVSKLLMHRHAKPLAVRAYPWVVRNRYLLSALGLHHVMNLFALRAQRRAQAALARTQGCKDGVCERTPNPE
ncbi:MAG: thiol-disulfide oxidoreductase DCC family protein [Burkholderiaceae bacterium]